MKNLRKYLIIAGILFFGLLGITKADILIPEHRVSLGSQITVKSNCIKFVDFYKVAGLNVIEIDKWRMNRPPFSTQYSFIKIPENECININTRNSNTEKYFYLSKTLYNGNIEFNEPLSYAKFQSLIKKNLGNAKLIYIDNILYTGKCDDEHYIKNGNTFEEGVGCDPTRRDKTEIRYSLEDNGKGGYQIIRTIGNNEEKEIIENIGKINNFAFLKALILTILLETFILFFLCKLFFKKDNLKTRKIILTGILASSITLPILRFVLPHIFHNYTVYAIVGEVFVTFVEVFIIKYLLDINRQKATIASIACNLFSVIIGLLL